MEWVSAFAGAFISPFKTSQEQIDSRKRKRSLTPQPNSRESRSTLAADHGEEETVEDSEEERQDRRARVVVKSRRTRSRTEAFQSTNAQNGRMPLPFEAVVQHRARKDPPATATDEDELDVLADSSCDELSGHNHDNLGAARLEWFTEQYQYQNAIEELEGKVQQKETEIRRMKTEIDDGVKRNADLEERGKEIQYWAKQTKQRHDDAQEKLRELERRCADAESRLEKSKGLLQARTEELTIAQAFMTTADQFSVAELSRAVEELNDDIYQTAMLLSDAFLEQKQKEPLGETCAGAVAGADTARTVVAKRYGEELTSRLVSDLVQDDTILFECLIQNVFVSRCTSLIRSICPTNAAADKVLRGVWENLSVTCEPAIAKNWLAMTSAKLKPTEVESASIAEAILCLMVVGGWRTEGFSATTVPGAVLEKISQIQSKALKVKEMATEGILSMVIEAFHVPARRAFNPTQMSDAYNVGKPSDATGNDVVICQTGLGLRCITRIAPPSGSSQAQRKIEILLQPKVLLASTLAPPPP